ncbi:Gfo/Idh/MocA family oxidoreductase [Sphingomonas sp. CROZ-RG-20F-R02-07]|uniref:Gfo/Idh/MocA family protein n=1 Tax=Sphingomonas sp. CROZ-RG-20F-R02-07 TaxID=2914832 RepID=UPI001F59CE07|nr:Gfo/Idh/MocA family oxidoreductase [Sphingomonas sp. CROZ-RG-20F-R02-07]
MSIASAFGFGKKIRYAVVGAGDIAQRAMMPGIDATGNSELVAIVTDDPEKAQVLGKRYGVDKTYGYDAFDAMLASGDVDAIYIATPNFRHAEFAIPALAAGIHVLCEKPLEISVARAEAIRDAQRASSAKLMVAYRLHFEPSTLDAIARIRSGELGDLVMFTSCFGQMLDPANHRARHGVEAGPIFDMAPYPINAIRYLFGEEPVAVVSAVGSRHAEAGFGDFDDTVAVTLRMPGDRLAQFTVSYFTNGIDSLIVAGTKGSIHMMPAYGFNAPRERTLLIGEKQHRETFKPTDQFGGEMRYFSDCILNGTDPEPDAEEGLADLRVIEGIVRALETGEPQPLAPFARHRRIDTDAQEERLRNTHAPDDVNAAPPTIDG